MPKVFVARALAILMVLAGIVFFYSQSAADSLVVNYTAVGTGTQTVSYGYYVSCERQECHDNNRIDSNNCNNWCSPGDESCGAPGYWKCTSGPEIVEKVCKTVSSSCWVEGTRSTSWSDTDTGSFTMNTQDAACGSNKKIKTLQQSPNNNASYTVTDDNIKVMTSVQNNIELWAKIDAPYCPGGAGAGTGGTGTGGTGTGGTTGGTGTGGTGTGGTGTSTDGAGAGGAGGAVCGNSVCESGESNLSCPTDCQTKFEEI